MPPRRNVEGQNAQGNDVPTNVELAQGLQQLTQLTQALGNALLQNQNGNDVAKRVAARHPPNFLGQEDPIIMEDWIRTFDKLFDAEADNWWANVGPVLRQQPNFGWETFKEEMRGRFYPAHVKMAKYDEFLHLRQGSMTVQEYYAKFLALARFAPTLVLDEPRKAEKFINGLNFETRKVVCALTFQTLNEAYSSVASHYRVQQIQKDINGRNKRKVDDDVQQGDKRPKFESAEPSRNFQRNSSNNNGRNRQGQGQGFVKMNQMGDMHFNCRICKRDHP
ncbi:uncharacterized protein LOC116020164 [Ipomoea triloba]|uniref:uncharacterized protein LOC116020164 n=1 Tax=Ipomoea triloba TaxID=35885 RepID=UPI00125D5DCB|nr:uncharacterized protein LOC116020164 [Ipomoea triloba]